MLPFPPKFLTHLVYKNSLDHRNEELQGIKARNEQLNKALELLQKSQQPSKKFKTNDNKWLPPPPQVPPDKNNGDVGNNSTSCLTDISLTDEDDAGTAGGSNLNMALNSEQLFETTIISPAKPEVSPIAKSASEMIISPRAKLMPRRNKQKENIRVAVDRNKILEKSKSELSVKETATSQSKSWAMALLKPSSSVLPKVVSAKEKKVGIDKKPEKKLNLSLKKVNPSKMKQSILHFNNSKDSSAIEVRNHNARY